MGDPFYRAVLSNRLEILFEGLKESLFFQKTNPFKKNICIVPSPAMKNWISHRLVNDQEEGICLGFDMKFLNEGIHRLVNKKVSFSHPLELSLKIEKELPSSFQGHRLLIAHELAQEFILFREHSTLIPEIEWQKKIWDAVFPSKCSFLEEIDQIDFTRSLLPEEIHLFCISYLTPAKHQFFLNLSRYTSVYAWILTPSRMYWEGRRRGVLDEEHPLLVSNGKIGREWFSIVDEPHVEMEEIFVIAEGISHEMKEGIITYPVEQKTLLHYLQSDLCLLNKPEEPLLLDATQSIQIHITPTIAREVDILFHLIREAFRNDSKLQPKDILILIPQIERYLPYLKAKEEEFPLEIGEVVETLELPLIKSWIQLLELPINRFHLDELLALLQNGMIQSNLDANEVFELKKALQAYKVEWGFDNAHKESLIGRPLGDKSTQGTIEDGIRKIVSSLVISSSEREFMEHSMAQEFYAHKLSLTEAESLNFFMEWIAKLRSFFQELHPRYIGDWVVFLESSVTEFLKCQSADDQQDQKVIFDALYQLNRLESGLLCYQDLLYLLKERFKEHSFIIKERNLNSISIHTLLPMRAVSSEVIIVMGLDPEEFPDQKGFKCSHEKLKKIVPTKRDFDRYLFVETLLSARKQWILTYSANSIKGHSPVIDDLLRYLDQHYRLEGKVPSEKIVFNHPLVAFEPSYYQIKYAGNADYRYAKQLTSNEDTKEPLFKAPVALEQLSYPLSHTLSLKELRMAFYHPLRFYINKALGIYLKRPVAYANLFEQFEEDEQLSLEFYQWIQWGDFERLLTLFKAKGYLPKEPFEGAAKEHLRKQYESYHKMLTKLQLQPQDFYSLEFNSGVEKLTKKSAREWLLPAPKVHYRGQKIEIVGKIPSMSPLGIVTWQKKERKSSVRLIPELLVQPYIPEEMGLPHVCYLKSGVSEKIESCEWEVVIENYLRLHEQPTPFLPAWIEPILESDSEALNEAIDSSLKPSFFDHSIDPYLKWAHPTLEQEISAEIIKDWYVEARRLFK